MLLDFLPLILFFVTFKVAQGRADEAAEWATRHLGLLVDGGRIDAAQAPVLLATLVVILATLAQVAVLAARGRRIEPMLWVSLVLVVVFGGATIWFHSETFIKWKPTVLYGVLALVLVLGRWVMQRNLIRVLLGRQLQLPNRIWDHLNTAWALFFALMAALNLWVVYRFDTETWVSFKLFGGMGLLLAFSIGQALVLSRHLQDPSAAPDESERERTPNPVDAAPQPMAGTHPIKDR